MDLPVTILMCSLSAVIKWCFWWDQSKWVGSIHIVCIGISW